MKKLVKVLGMAAALTALPVAFTGGSAGDGPSIHVSSVCADPGKCETEIGSTCTDGDTQHPNQRGRTPGEGSDD